MAPPALLHLTVPLTSTSDTKPPYTLYHVSVPLPLRTPLQKRYTDFVELHSSLYTIASATPPALPAKSWLTSTISSPSLRESRRKELESWLQLIAVGEESRWRDTDVWRKFLQLPSSSAPSIASKLGGGEIGGVEALQKPVTDPSEWVDTQIAMKALLHDARLSLARRDREDTPKAQHECRADARRALTRVSAMLLGLEQGLVEMEKTGNLGRGECRRRKDVIGTARREARELERLVSDGAPVRGSMASDSQRAELMSQGSGGMAASNGNGSVRRGRVIGKPVAETDETRERDNQGVLQLQQQLMKEQDQDVEALARIIARQRELGLDISREIAEQDNTLDALEADGDRVQSKLKVVNKRVRKIH